MAKRTVKRIASIIAIGVVACLAFAVIVGISAKSQQTDNERLIGGEADYMYHFTGAIERLEGEQILAIRPSSNSALPLDMGKSDLVLVEIPESDDIHRGSRSDLVPGRNIEVRFFSNNVSEKEEIVRIKPSSIYIVETSAQTYSIEGDPS